MKKDIRREFTICSNAAIGRDTYLMRLCGDTEGLERPGQFVNVCLPDKYLRRPISVCDYTDGELLLMYKVVGEGTAEMERMKEGEKVQLLLPLGNGFDTSASGPKPLLLGGGIGVAPLYGLARQLVAEGKEPTVVVGFNTGEEAFFLEQFGEICRTEIATLDGSKPGHWPKPAVAGYVTDAVRALGLEGSYFYACGPMPMMRAVAQGLELDGQLSLEARMGCGFGACMCCSLQTRDGAKRICKEGPVFRKEELLWT